MNNEYMKIKTRKELNDAYSQWILDKSIEFTNNYIGIKNPKEYIYNNSYFLTVSLDFRGVVTASRHSKKKTFKNNFRKNNKEKDWKKAYKRELKKFDYENSIYNASQFYCRTNTGKLLLDNYNGIFNKLNRITNNVRSYNNLNNVMFHAAFLDVAGTRNNQTSSSHFYPHLHSFILCPPEMKTSLKEAIKQLNENMKFNQNYTIKSLDLKKIGKSQKDNDTVRSYISKYIPLNCATMKSDEDFRFYPKYEYKNDVYN